MRILMVVTDIFFIDLSGGSRRTYETAKGFLSKGFEVIVFSNKLPNMKSFEVIEGIKVYRKKMIEPGAILRKLLKTATSIILKMQKKLNVKEVSNKDSEIINKKQKIVQYNLPKSTISEFDDFHFKRKENLKEKLKDIYRHKFPIFKFIKTWGAIKDILNIIKKEKIDIIYERGGSYGVGLLCAKLTRRINFTEFIDILYWDWALKNTDMVTSYFTKAHVPQFVSRDKIKTVYTSVDINKFNPNVPIDRIKKKYNLNKNNFIGIYVGGFYSWHGLETIIEAVHLIHNDSRFNNLRSILKIFLVGKGEKYETIKSMIMKYPKLKDTIILTDRVPFNEVPSYINTATFCLTLNQFDAIGLKTFEYMACAKPLISTNVDLVPYFFKDGENILLIPPNNPEKLAEKILYLFEHQEEGKIIGRNARELVVQKYSLNQHINNLIDTLKIIISKKKQKKI